MMKVFFNNNNKKKKKKKKRRKIKLSVNVSFLERRNIELKENFKIQSNA